MTQRWTDEQLLSLCRRESVSEVDPEGIAALRQRWNESESLREAVADSPLRAWWLEQLAVSSANAEGAETRSQALPGNASPEALPQVPTPSAVPDSNPPQYRGSLRSRLVILLLLALVVIPIYRAVRNLQRVHDEASRPKEAQVATDDPSKQVDPTPAHRAESNSASPSDTVGVPAVDGPETPADRLKPGIQQATDTTSKPSKTIEPDAVWSGPLDVQIPPLSWESTVFQPIAADSPDSLPPDVFRKWFGQVAGSPLRISEDKVDKRTFTIVEGLTRLLAPWVENAVLRLGLFNVERCQIVAWGGGNEGVRLSFTKADASPQLWIAHRVTRANPTSPLVLGDFLGTDNGRWEMTRFGVVELRVEGGHVMLARGQVPLLRVPFEGRPDDVTIEGKFRVRDFRMYRGDPLPVDGLDNYRSPIGTAKLASSNPTELDWKVTPDDAVSFEKIPSEGKRSGAVELKTTKALKEPAWASLTIPKAGLCEFIVRVEHADAGTGLCLGAESGTLFDKLSIMIEPKSKRLVVAAPFPWLQPTEFTKDTASGLSTVYFGPTTWFRIVASAGSFQVWVSHDGRDWSWLGQHNFPNEWRRIEAVRLFSLPGADRRLRISHFEVREFKTITALADAALCERVDVTKFQPLLQHDLSGWLHQVIRTRPEDVPLSAWRRACAVESLRIGPSPTLSLTLLSGLASDGLFGELALAPLPLDSDASPVEVLERTLERDWHLLAELALLHHLPGYEQGVNFSLLWAAVIDKHVTLRNEYSSSLRSGPNPNVPAAPQRVPQRWIVERFLEAMLVQPLWSSNHMKLFPIDSARRELTSLVHGGRNSDILEGIDRLTFFLTDPHPLQPWWGTIEPIYNHFVWGETNALLAVDGDTQMRRLTRPQRWKAKNAPMRHPLTQPFSKEAYNLMAEFQAALSSESYGDACQVIGAAASAQMLGFVPDSKEASLLVSFPRAIASAMDDHPALQSTMNEKYGAIARLRVQQAMDVGDVGTLEAATVQFYGTLAAAMSERWLGDRAFAAGQFAQAQSHYIRAKDGFARHSQVQTQETLELEARMQLVASMMGLNDPAVLNSAKAFGDQAISQQQLDALSLEFVSEGGASRSSDVASHRTLMNSKSQATSKVPPIQGYRWEPRTKFEGEMGVKPESFSGADVDWFARQMAVTVDDDKAYLSNRFQVSCLDLKSGKWIWNAPLRGDVGNTHHWPKVAMAPLVSGPTVFCRRLTSKRPELHALHKATGELRWRADVKANIVSDLWIARGRLQAFATDANALATFELQLLTFDLETGRLLSEVPIVRLLDEAQPSTQACQVTTRDDLLYFAVSGVVGCCNTQGQTIWLRNQLWQPPALDALRHVRAYDAPLLVGDVLIVTQPGVPVVEALDPANGRVRWSRSASDLQRLVGITTGRLIVETNAGLEAWSPTTGETQWRFRTSDLLDAVLLPDASGKSLVAGASTLVSSHDGISFDKSHSSDQSGKIRTKSPSESRYLLVSRSIERIDYIKVPCLAWIDVNTGREVAFHRFDDLSDKLPKLGPMFVAGDKTWAFVRRTKASSENPLMELVPQESTTSLHGVVDQTLWAGWFPEFQRETLPSGVVVRPSLSRRVLSTYLREPYAKQAPGWLVAGPLVLSRDSGHRAEFRGRKDVLALQLTPNAIVTTHNIQQPDIPIESLRFVRQLDVPTTGNPTLEIAVGHDPKREWELIIDADSQRLHRSIISDTTAADGWQNIRVPLTSLIGKTTTLVITCVPIQTGGATWIYLERLPPLDY